MAFPSESKLKKIREKLEKEKGTLHLNADATPLEKFRWRLCQEILAYKQDHDLKQRDLAKLLKIDEAVISRILHYRIERLSTDKLIEYLQRLEPQLDLKVS